MTSIHIDNDRKSKRLMRIVSDLSPESTGDDDGFLTGSIRMSAADLELLYKAGLYINVATAGNERALRGRLVPQIMTEAHELARPILMRSDDATTAVSGIAWANVDSTCTLNYQVRTWDRAVVVFPMHGSVLT